MNKEIRELVETTYNLPKNKAEDTTIRYLFTYFNMHMVLKRGLIDLAESSEGTKDYYFMMVETLEEKVYDLQSDVLRRIREYGQVTLTNVSSIDDMKVMHFLAQSLTVKCLNLIPTQHLKAVTKVSYEYMKRQLYYVSPKDFSCVMIDKIDHLYDNENISIREIWDLFGRFGIYSQIKLLYMLHTRINESE